jgi:hypothetical protein
MGGKRSSDADGQKGHDDNEQAIDAFHSGSLGQLMAAVGTCLSIGRAKSVRIPRPDEWPSGANRSPLVEGQQICAHAPVERQRRLCDLRDEKAASAIFRAGDLISRFR